MNKPFNKKIWLLAVTVSILAIPVRYAHAEVQLKEPKRFESPKKIVSKNESIHTTPEELNIQRRIELTSSLMTEPKTITSEDQLLQGTSERGVRSAVVNGSFPGPTGENGIGAPVSRQNPLQSRYRVHQSRHA